MWDMKPIGRRRKIRGEFRADAHIAWRRVYLASICRIWLGIMHRATLVRSMHHSVNNAHAAGVYVGLTGPRSREKIGGRGAGPDRSSRAGDRCSALLRPTAARRSFLTCRCPFITKEGAGGPSAARIHRRVGSAAIRDPLFVLRDPNGPNFGMPEELGLDADVSASRTERRRRALITSLAAPSAHPGRRPIAP